MKSAADEIISRFPKCKSILAAIVDQNGVLRGKRFPIKNLQKVLNGSSRLPLSLCNLDIWGLNIAPPLPDYLAGDRDGDCTWTGRAPMPDTWLEEPSLLVPLTMSTDQGEPFLGDPRRVLEWVLARYRDTGFTPVAALELEFYLVALKDGKATPPHSPKTGEALLPSSALPISELEQFNAFIDDVYGACETHDIPLDAAIAECGAGQFEINLLHSEDAMKVADDAIFFKRLVKNIARKHNLIASFMAKPYPGQPGSGMHVHFNVQDGKRRNMFANGTPEGSETLHHALAGMLEAMIPCGLIFAPHLNSYRRYEVDAHAPTRANWGFEDRAAAIRVPGGNVDSKRIEHRVAGADANPYLVLAAVLSAALSGISNHKKLEDGGSSITVHDDKAPLLTTDWVESRRNFIESTITAECLPAELIEMFSACKHQEIITFKQHMSNFELNAYLENT